MSNRIGLKMTEIYICGYRFQMMKLIATTNQWMYTGNKVDKQTLKFLKIEQKALFLQQWKRNKAISSFVIIWKDKLHCLFRRKLESQMLAFHELQDWLENDRNIYLWMRYSAEKLNVKHRRIFITQWLGETHEKLRGPECQKLRYSCFWKTNSN